MARLLLALLLAFPGAGPAVYCQAGGEPPVDIRTQPDAVSAGDRELLKAAGYCMDDGTIRLGEGSPLTAAQLAEVLAWLKHKDQSRAERRPAPSSEHRLESPRARLIMERLVKAWDRTTGQEITLSASLYSDGLPLAVPAPGRTGQPGRRSPVGSNPSLRAQAAAGPRGAAQLSDAAQLRDAAAQLPAPPQALLGGRSAALVTEPVRAFEAAAAPAGPAPADPAVASVDPNRQQAAAPAAPISGSPGVPANPKAPEGRVASIFFSDDLLAQIVNDRIKDSAVLKDFMVEFDPAEQEILAKGRFIPPVEDLRTLNLDEKAIPDFRFKLTMHFKTTKEGYLILEFPLDETFFYPATSKDPKKDRVIVPVQLLELVLAATRGYLGVLAGDTSGYDKKAARVLASIKALEKVIAATQDPDEKAALTDRRALLALELQSIPIEKRQAERLGKKFGGVLGLVGKQEGLDKALAASRNSIILKLRLDQFVPYFKGIQLGGIRVVEDNRDGDGEKYVAIDLVAEAP